VTLAPLAFCCRLVSELLDADELAESCLAAAGAATASAVEPAAPGGEAAPPPVPDDELELVPRERAIELGTAPLPMRKLLLVEGLGGTAVKRDGWRTVEAGEAVREDGAEAGPPRGACGRDGRVCETERAWSLAGAESRRTALRRRRTGNQH